MKRLIILLIIGVAVYFGYSFYKKKVGSLTGSSDLEDLPDPEPGTEEPGTDPNGNEDPGEPSPTHPEPGTDDILYKYEMDIVNDNAEYAIALEKAESLGMTIDQVLRFYAIVRAKQDGTIPADYAGTSLLSVTQFVMQTVK